MVHHDCPCGFDWSWANVVCTLFHSNLKFSSLNILLMLNCGPSTQLLGYLACGSCSCCSLSLSSLGGKICAIRIERVLVVLFDSTHLLLDYLLLLILSTVYAVNWLHHHLLLLLYETWVSYTAVLVAMMEAIHARRMNYVRWRSQSHLILKITLNLS